MANSLFLDGTRLTTEELARFVDDSSWKIVLADEVLRRLDSAHAALMEKATKEIIYGVNTGFGPMASQVINKKDLLQLQKNLIHSHATGVGEPIAAKFILAAMVIRLNTLVRGNSGISSALARALCALINNRIIPVVPKHGAVGTSGDLVQLAHIAGVLLGKGEVFVSGVRMDAKAALKRAGLRPYALKPKEGLALINGTSVMTGIAALLFLSVKRLLDVEITQSATALDVIGGFDDSIDPHLHLLRPHEGQILIAERMRKHLKDSRSLQKRSEFTKATPLQDKAYQLPELIQNVYSFRCAPQILGPLSDTLAFVMPIIETEMNATTDNPVYLPQIKKFLHGGNFHGDYIATAIDQLKIPLVKLSILSERRINYFLDHSLNHHFPPFLNKQTPGLTLALQGLQFVATSTTADNQSLAYPHSLHSISTNASNQDVVSMGTDAALMLSEVVQNTAIVLAIEAIALAQAIDLLDRKEQRRLARASRAYHKRIRKNTKVVTEDRGLGRDVERIAAHFLSDHVT